MAQVNKLIDVGGHEKNVGPMWSVDAESIKRDSSWSLLKEHLSNFRSNPDDFYRWLTPLDEVWIYYFESEAKKQSMGWKHHGSHVPREFLQQFRSGKIASSVFWDNEGFSWVTVGIVDSHYRWLPRHPVKKKHVLVKLRHKVVFHRAKTLAQQSVVAMAAINDTGFETVQ